MMESILVFSALFEVAIRYLVPLPPHRRHHKGCLNVESKKKVKRSGESVEITSQEDNPTIKIVDVMFEICRDTSKRGILFQLFRRRNQCLFTTLPSQCPETQRHGNFLHYHGRTDA